LEQNIDALAEELDEYDLIRSIPGVGPKIAATILSEIGEIDRFNHPKKLVALRVLIRVSLLLGSSQLNKIASPNAGKTVEICPDSSGEMRTQNFS
jgi:transposase